MCIFHIFSKSEFQHPLNETFFLRKTNFQKKKEKKKKMSISWILPPSGELSRLIHSDGSTFDDIISHEKFMDDFRKQDATLHQYLLDHMKELANVALGIEQSRFHMGQQVCFSIITSTSPPSFNKILATNQTFIQCLHDALFNQADFEGKKAAAFTRIFQHMLKTNNQCYIMDFPDKEKLFQRFVELIKYPAFANLLNYLTEVGEPRVLTFFEESGATETLLNAIGDNDEMNVILIKSIIRIIDLVDNDSPILNPFNDNKNIEKLYNIGISSQNKALAGVAFKTILQLCSYIEEGENPDDVVPLSNILTFVQSKLDEICNFIVRDTVFLDVKFHCVEIVSGVSLMMDETPKCLFTVCEFLFNQLFLQPQHSFLHKSFLNLFEAIVNDTPEFAQFIDQCKMHERIVDAFAHRKEMIANYWPYLFRLSEHIMDKGTCDQNWKDFIATTYTGMATIMNTDYGGPLPRDTDDDEDEDEDDFKFFGHGEEEEYFEEDEFGENILGGPSNPLPASRINKQVEEEEERDYSSGEEMDDSDPFEDIMEIPRTKERINLSLKEIFGEEHIENIKSILADKSQNIETQQTDPNSQPDLEDSLDSHQVNDQNTESPEKHDDDTSSEGKQNESRSDDTEDEIQVDI